MPIKSVFCLFSSLLYLFPFCVKKRLRHQSDNFVNFVTFTKQVKLLFSSPSQPLLLISQQPKLLTVVHRGALSPCNCLENGGGGGGRSGQVLICQGAACN